MTQRWSDIRYRLDPVNDDRISRVVDAIQLTHVNGGMLIACFAPLIVGEFNEAANSDLSERFDAVRAFLESPDLSRCFPKLSPVGNVSELTFCKLGCYALEGELVQILRSSGAYKDSEVSPATARRMAVDFVDAIGKDRREHLIAYRTEEPWATWFCDVAWDVTLIVFDRCHSRWWLICVTDTD